MSYWVASLVAVWTAGPLALLERAGRLLRTPRARRDSGYATETVVVITMLVVLAISAVGILTAKVMAKVNSLDLDG